MKLSFAAVISCALCTAVHADPAASTLQQRATEELAADGIALAARNLELRVEPADSGLAISIVEHDTGRIVGATTLAPVPADPDAAVASIAHVAAGLLAQAAPAPVVVVDHSAADHEYARRAIHFNDVYDTSGAGHVVTTTRHWAAYQGELNAELSRPDFYRLVGRPDLADRFQTHRRVALVLLGVSVVGVGVAVGTMAEEGTAGPFATSGSTAAFVGGLGVCLGAFLGAAAVGLTADGVSPAGAVELGDHYNEQLRQSLQLPGAATATPRASVHLSFAGNGLALTGTF
jgi:hypothetical protein